VFSVRDRSILAKIATFSSYNKFHESLLTS
jgi:hypothetical protein